MILGTPKAYFYMLGADAMPDASGYLVCGETRSGSPTNREGTYGGLINSYDLNWEAHWSISSANYVQYHDKIPACKYGEAGFVYFAL